MKNEICFKEITRDNVVPYLNSLNINYLPGEKGIDNLYAALFTFGYNPESYSNSVILNEYAMMIYDSFFKQVKDGLECCSESLGYKKAKNFIDIKLSSLNDSLKNDREVGKQLIVAWRLAQRLDILENKVAVNTILTRVEKSA